jgi:hypothetical protein
LAGHRWCSFEAIRRIVPGPPPGLFAALCRRLGPAALLGRLDIRASAGSGRRAGPVDRIDLDLLVGRPTVGTNGPPPGRAPSERDRGGDRPEARGVDDLPGRILEVALDELCRLYHLNGMAMAIVPPGRSAGEADVLECLPADWSPEHGSVRALHRHLLALLAPPMRAPGPGPSGELPVAGRTLWLYRVPCPGWSVGVVAVRTAPFDAVERRSLEMVTEALTVLLAGPSPDPDRRQAMAERSSIALKAGSGATVVAELLTDWPQPPRPLADPHPTRRAGVGRGTSAVVAVARAAAKASRPRCTLVFAGTAPLDDHQIALTVVEDVDHKLRLGVARRAPGDLGAVAESVFAAGFSTGRCEASEPLRS